MTYASEEVLTKTAHLVGVTRAMLANGYSPDGVKLAFVQAGLFPTPVADLFVKEAAEIEFTKEAAFPLLAAIPAAMKGIAGLGAKIAPWLLGKGKALGAASAASRAAGAGMKGTLQTWGGKAAKGLGMGTARASGAFRQAGQAFQANPGQALWGGTKNFAKGTFLGRGQGLGGGLGRATLYGGLAAGGVGMVRNMRQQPQQMYPQQY